MTDKAICELCGEPMPKGEEMFKYHGHSGPCPVPIRADKQEADNVQELIKENNKLIAYGKSAGGPAFDFVKYLERNNKTFQSLTTENARLSDLVFNHDTVTEQWSKESQLKDEEIARLQERVQELEVALSNCCDFIETKTGWRADNYRALLKQALTGDGDN